jgi:hypothetical protein
MTKPLRKIHKSLSSSLAYLITDYRLLMTTLALALSGCMGVYEGGFECPPGEGVGCKSISEVNEMVTQCSVRSTQYSECKIPGLKAITDPIELSDSADPKPDFQNFEIWYSPWFISDQISKQSTQQPTLSTAEAYEQILGFTHKCSEKKEGKK